ncbi:MAG: protein-methionine-sulfoxide reductase catalytic subunit MsrP [Marivivens sp.]|jgi:methionine sulfoxide reductase catalytic subunit|uniref:protein-methionine-sulfoxide reductase catalytic subunit MsrP n=1 Tax=Marivivens sp. TaxID=1978374 RepID=UPI0017DCD807|nr:protein-methionine-sulfoxide reductase catalytic subunit MsrP [Marivivens sp.]MCL7407024.1 protein-methionine-sulfoxide reductase catalytic subunit MsrP [Marivivens geojensis]NBT51713.1 protein-methionine-sulfoxide reductase catalytic subunit MsrP [Marivivens sp.]NBX09892.1 protein-methionine-sulfoxide reductase catalytic subunit MsrP [Marivivens sp.]NVJ95987.1 protein-methionine-sulfoxide reductase catalytic subunit MsrP [Marivivens sp.]NVK05902.1 protein-methionine-sulfoxide reductase cat
MAFRWKNDLTEKDITPKQLWLNRRQIIAAAGASVVGMPALAQSLEPNTLSDIRSYNNYYEFGTGKEDPAQNANKLDTSNWTIKVDGLVDNPGDYSLADLLGGLSVEERIYRFRCVEAWSMVVPWNGVELADVLNRVGVKSSAKYVAFETVVQPDNMIGVQRRVIPFPYVEGLRLDEARHPLTLLATGIYGEPMANQNGAPIRLVVPWKYGFKSIKSIVRITLTDKQPPATWNLINAREYGFYSNVNPNVSHPRWSQASERRIGGGLFASRQDTLMFNGYDEVASLYDGMNLAENF